MRSLGRCFAGVSPGVPGPGEPMGAGPGRLVDPGGTSAGSDPSPQRSLALARLQAAGIMIQRWPARPTPTESRPSIISRVQCDELCIQPWSASSLDGASASASPTLEPPGTGQPWSTARTPGSASAVWLNCPVVFEVVRVGVGRAAERARQHQRGSPQSGALLVDAGEEPGLGGVDPGRDRAR